MRFEALFYRQPKDPFEFPDIIPRSKMAKFTVPTWALLPRLGPVRDEPGLFLQASLINFILGGEALP
jgi:hypothetical protein